MGGDSTTCMGFNNFLEWLKFFYQFYHLLHQILGHTRMGNKYSALGNVCPTFQSSSNISKD